MKTLFPYRYKRHSIEPLPSRVCGTDGWLYWLVCPDNGAGSWYARSLADARESINSKDPAPAAQEVA
jgi:hypothetical protein